MSFSMVEIAEFLEKILDTMPQSEHFYRIRKSFACLPIAVIVILIKSKCKTFENILATTKQSFSSSEESNSWRTFCNFRNKYNKLQKLLKIKSVAKTSFILAQVLCRSEQETQDGPVYCESLGIHFPALYRATVITTMKHLKEVGADFDSEFKPGTWFAFELSNTSNCEYLGDVTWDIVHCIRQNEQDESIVIRFHKSHEAASAYLHGYIDTDNDNFFQEMCKLYKTDKGYFTFINIKSKEEWDGPLIFYLAEIPNEPFEWAFIVGSDGLPRDVSDFGY